MGMARSFLSRISEPMFEHQELERFWRRRRGIVAKRGRPAPTLVEPSRSLIARMNAERKSGRKKAPSDRAIAWRTDCTYKRRETTRKEQGDVEKDFVVCCLSCDPVCNVRSESGRMEQEDNPDV